MSLFEERTMSFLKEPLQALAEQMAVPSSFIADFVAARLLLKPGRADE